VPAVRVVRSRPEHTKPALQVPALPVPQHPCPEAPQVEQTSPAVAITHEPAVHGVGAPQQVWPSAPHGPQVPAFPCAAFRPEHAKPALHVPALPVPQQPCPEPPQVEQTLPPVLTTHEPAVHGVAPTQQACPSAPQGPQVPVVPCAAFRPEQAKPASQVPVLPVPQQACPEPPQVAEQTLPPAERTHPRPVPHVFAPTPGQQAWPAPPQALHVPAPRPPSLAPTKQPSPPWQLLPAQQAAPSAPQLSQVPPAAPVTLQPRPVLHSLAEQHGCPEPPHAVHTWAPPVPAAQISDP